MGSEPVSVDEFVTRFRLAARRAADVIDEYNRALTAAADRASECLRDIIAEVGSSWPASDAPTDVYRDAQVLDEFAGSYPGTDVGSSSLGGLSRPRRGPTCGCLAGLDAPPDQHSLFCPAHDSVWAGPRTSVIAGLRVGEYPGGNLHVDPGVQLPLRGHRDLDGNEHHGRNCGRANGQCDCGAQEA